MRLIIVVVAILAASGLSVAQDHSVDVSNFFSGLADRIRESVAPHMEDLRESVGDLQRHIEQHGGVDGVRVDVREAIDELNTKGRTIVNRGAAMFGHLLDSIESNIDGITGAVRTGLSSLVQGGRKVLREVPTSREVPVDDGVHSVRTADVRRKRSVNNDNKGRLTAELRPYLTEYEKFLQTTKATLQDIHNELSSVGETGRPSEKDPRFLSPGLLLSALKPLMPKVASKIKEATGNILQGKPAVVRIPESTANRVRSAAAIPLPPVKAAVPNKIASNILGSSLHLPRAGVVRHARDVPEPRANKSNENNTSVMPRDLRDILNSYKKHFDDISQLLSDIRHDVSGIRQSVR